MRESIAYDRDFLTGTLNKYMKHKPDKAIAKGIATIQLMDNTGQVVREVQSENLITDQAALLAYQGYVNYAFRGKSASEAFAHPPFSGLLLTQYEGPENTNDITRGFPIGYASTSSQVSSDDTMGGSYNKAESSLTYKAGSNPYAKWLNAKYHWHIVIDFPTHAANGTFQTIYAQQDTGCMNAGYRWNLKPLPFLKDSPGDDLSWYKKSASGHCWTYNDGCILFVNTCYDSSSDGTKHFEIYKFDMHKKSYSVFNVDKSWYKDEKLRQAVYRDNTSRYSVIQYDGVNNLLYMFANDDAYINMYKEYLKVDLNNRSISLVSIGEDTHKYTGGSFVCRLSYCAYVRNGFLYIALVLKDKEKNTGTITLINCAVLKYDSNGTLVGSGNQEFDNTEKVLSESNIGYYRTPFLFGPDFISFPPIYKDSSIRPAFDYDFNFIGMHDNKYLDILPDSSFDNNCAYNEELKGFLTSGATPSIDEGVLNFGPVYLPRRPTSHNRLPAPVTKTAAHTMKLQYDIYFDRIGTDIQLPDWAEE